MTWFLYTYSSIHFQILYSFKLLQNTWQTSLCYIVSTCNVYISILNSGWVIVKRLFAIVKDTDPTGTVTVDMVRNGLTVRIFLKQTPDDDDLSIVCVHSRSVLYDSLWLHGLLSTKLLCPWHFPGKNIGVGCHALLQGIFPTQGIEPRSPTWQVYSLPLEPPVKPKVKPRWLWFDLRIVKYQKRRGGIRTT